MAVQKEFLGKILYGDPEHSDGLSVFSDEFDLVYEYKGNDLGSTYYKDGTDFNLWAPTAASAKVRIYENGLEEGKLLSEHAMTRSEQGVWRLKMAGDWKGAFYTFAVLIGGHWNEAADPYARAVGINGMRAAVIDLVNTNPEGWGERMEPFGEPVDAIIYEVNVRDLTIHPESGVRHKGKYLGAAEEDTCGAGGSCTGLAHIKSLGVTHVQFLPLFDFSPDSVDEAAEEGSMYNWGYDPQNYNAPEGSYATDPYDPLCRIRELKTMIQAYHNQGLRVIMDVVYNHVYDAYRMSFMKLVPGYYYRYSVCEKLSDGSGCGNDIASERSMVRKFIVDSVLFWAKEYHMDGFRFDLMGLLDIETMNKIRTELDAIDPSIIMLGEGWYMHTPLHDDQKANQRNAYKLPRIAQFNDAYRDSLKGSVFFGPDSGFVSNKGYLENEMKKGIAGGIYYKDGIGTFAHEPNQTITYAEAHDNLTLWDKLEQSMAWASVDERKLAHRLVSSMLLTSQGITFIHAGQEFMRTKGGNHNSYCSPTEVNWMDWRRSAEHREDVEYMKQLIALRKAHPAFRMPTAEMIRHHLVFEPSPGGSAAYTLRDHANGDPAKHLFVLHNANGYEIEVEVPALGSWKTLFGVTSLIQSVHTSIKSAPRSTIVLQCLE